MKKVLFVVLIGILGVLAYFSYEHLGPIALNSDHVSQSQCDKECLAKNYFFPDVVLLGCEEDEYTTSCSYTSSIKKDFEKPSQWVSIGISKDKKNSMSYNKMKGISLKAMEILESTSSKFKEYEDFNPPHFRLSYESEDEFFGTVYSEVLSWVKDSSGNAYVTFDKREPISPEDIQKIENLRQDLIAEKINF